MLSKNRWAQAKRSDRPRAEPEPEHADLATMAQVRETECTRVFGVQFDDAFARARLPCESAALENVGQPALHITSATPRSLPPPFAWASGTRHWTASELEKLKALQVKMTRGIVPRLSR